MRAQAAGEKAIAIRILHDVAGVQPAGGETAHHHRGPDIHILARVRHHDRLAGGAARRMQAHDILHRTGKQAEGIRVAQIGLGGKRQGGDVFETLQIAGLDAALLHARTVQRHGRPSPLDDAAQPAELQLPQDRGWQIVRRAFRLKRSCAGR
jgi:hypothetical protein